jgi:hypothetical protein
MAKAITAEMRKAGCEEPKVALHDMQEASRRLWEGLAAHNTGNRLVRDLHMRELANMLIQFGVVS